MPCPSRRRPRISSWIQLLSLVGVASAWVVPVPHSWSASSHIHAPARPTRATGTHVLKAQGSSFDGLGMPKIRPRGQRDEKPAEEEGPQEEDVPPMRPVPELITMNAFELLIEPTDEVGLFMREVMLKYFDYSVRLPRPALFSKGFHAAYQQRRKEFPNFGAGVMTSEEWWAPIFYKAYLDLDIPKDELDEVFVDVFEELYYEALVSDWAWEPIDDVLPLLDKLQEWRLEGGPKLAVVTDFDERLTTILDNLEMSHYFDAVVSTTEAGAGKPDPAVFKLAMEKAGVTDPSKVMHFGPDFDRDVVGAAAAGVESFWVVCPSYDRLEPEQEALKVNFQKVGDLEAILEMYGRTDPERLITTTWKNKNRPDDLFVRY